MKMHYLHYKTCISFLIVRQCLECKSRTPRLIVIDINGGCMFTNAYIDAIWLVCDYIRFLCLLKGHTAVAGNAYLFCLVLAGIQRSLLCVCMYLCVYVSRFSHFLLGYSSDCVEIWYVSRVHRLCGTGLIFNRLSHN